jgi:hypothetical protein
VKLCPVHSETLSLTALHSRREILSGNIGLSRVSSLKCDESIKYNGNAEH